MIDQCTRSESGGELIKWYKKTSIDTNLRSYIKYRTGYAINPNRNKPEPFWMKFKNLSLIKLKFKAQFIFSKIITSLLPCWFQLNHISKTATGEKHLWVYDFNSISDVLKQAGGSGRFVAAWNYIDTFNANDYIEIIWQSDDINMQLAFDSGSGNYPSIPSVIATLTQVSI
jgi:hypothetical protein